MSVVRLQAKVREPGGSFDYYRPENPLQTTIDGFSGTSTGAVMTKLETYRMVAVESDDGVPVERRLHEVTLAIPTRVLLEFCAAFLSGARENKSALLALSSEEARKLSVLLEGDS